MTVQMSLMQMNQFGLEVAMSQMAHYLLIRIHTVIGG